MKSLLKVVAVGSAITLGVAALPVNSYAGNREWATVGKVLTGVAAVGVLSAIIHDTGHPNVNVHIGYRTPPPPPVCAPPQRWIPGHYESRPERVCIPGYWSVVSEPPQYGWVWHGRHKEWTVIRPGYTRRVWVAERYEVRETRVWVPAYTEGGRYAYSR